MKKAFLVFLSVLTLASSTFASDLMDIYQQSLDNDPVFKKAYSTYMSSTEAIPQARASLYPQVLLSGQSGRYVADDTGFGFQAHQTYSSHLFQVNASQALFNVQAWEKIKQATASVKASQAQFNDAAQNLMLRSTRAYLNVLLAKDTVIYATAKKQANKRQLDQAQQRFKVGLSSITSVYEAEAAFDQSVAEVIAANNNLINQNENLRQLTNHVYVFIAPLRNDSMPLLRPEPNDVNEWIDTGLRQNYNLFASKYTKEAARDNLKAQSTAGWPTLAIQANVSRTRNDVQDNSFFIPQLQTTSSLNFAFNYPLVRGGLIESQTRQAQYDFMSASEQFENDYRALTVSSRIAFNTIIDGISKIKADRKTVHSQLNSLDSTEAQFTVGTRTMVDVTNAQQRLYNAQRQLAQDQYDFIYALLNLKYLAGNLNANDLEEVNSWLAGSRIHHFPDNH